MHPGNLKIEDFTYKLPEHKIALFPKEERDLSRLLVYKNRQITEDIYYNINNYLPENSMLFFNKTKVINARLLFKKQSGSIIEIFCLNPDKKYGDINNALSVKKQVEWECLVGGAGKWKNDLVLELKNEFPDFTLFATLKEKLAKGTYLINIECTDPHLTFAEILNFAGKIPLPPYLNRKEDKSDIENYQTIFAQNEGSVAAPTAGLHFTERILNKLPLQNICTHFVTLHVGAGTFMPVKSDTMQGHTMHTEWIEVNLTTIEKLLQELNQKIIAVGTTSLRTIESLYWIGMKLHQGLPLDIIAVSQWDAYKIEDTISVKSALDAIINYLYTNKLDKLITQTQLLICPGYQFKIVKGLVTNFHQPKSTLLLLVAAFIGTDWKNIYNYALENDFRFLSYGDGCLLLPDN